MATDPGDLGPRIRRRRLALGMTLEALAGASGVSTTMLSEVERSVKNPTVRLAYQIARALHSSLTDLLEEDPGRPATIVPAAARRTLIDPDTAVERHGLSTELLKRGLEVVWYVIPSGVSAGEMAPNRPGILEHLTVIRGTLTLRLGQERHSLSKGDSVTYGPQVTTEYANDGAEPCEFLLLSDSSRAF